MQRVKPWLERDFAFDTPAWMYPHVVERVRGGPARLEDVLRDVRAAKLTQRRNGNWSMQEEAGHLLGHRTAHVGTPGSTEPGEQALTAWDGKNEATWNAQHNAKSLTDILLAFRHSREALARRLDDLPEEMVERAAHHPRLNKPMRVIDLAAFVAEHDEYHPARISAAKRVHG